MTRPYHRAIAPDAAAPSIVEACANPSLLAVDLSDAQRALLKAIYALPMTKAEFALFAEATACTEAPTVPFRSISVLAGRRSGKSSRCCAPLAVYEACIANHEIPPNERGVVLVLGPTERQARITFRIILKMIERSPKLRALVENVRAGGGNEIELANSIDIRVVASNQRTVRGDLIVAAVLEEACFFTDSDSGQFNLEQVIDALRPALLTLPDSKLIRVSSPWVGVGPMFDDFANRAERRDTLCWKLPSWTMNPSINSALLWFEKKRDPQKFAREYGCEFLDVSNVLIPSELVDAAVARGVAEFAPAEGRSSVAALDPSSRGTDAFGFALAHKESDGRVVLDLARQWRAPGGGQYIDYTDVIAVVVARMRAYRASRVWSDQICAAALAAEFAKVAIEFTQTPTFGAKAAAKYQTVRQLFVAGKVVLPENPALVAQFKKLAENFAEGGRSFVAASSGKDDLAVVACLALYEASLQPEAGEPFVPFAVFSGDRARDDERNWHKIN